MADQPQDEKDLWTFEERWSLMRKYLISMQARLVPKIDIREVPDSKALWRVLVLFQCLIRRTLELSHGVERAWRDQEYLTVVTLARMLIETAAFAWDVCAGVEDGIAKADFRVTSKFIDDRTHATKIDEWVEDGLPRAVSIMSHIDRMDRDVALEEGESPKDQVIRGHYDLLSEFVHPNQLGVSILYGTLEADQRTVRFGLSEERRERLGRTVGVSLEAIWMMHRCLTRMDKFSEPLRELDRKYATEKQR